MQAFPPRSVSEAPHSAAGFGASAYANPFVTAPSHAAQYTPMVAGMGPLGASSFNTAAPSLMGPGAAGPGAASANLPRSLTDRAVGFDAPALLGRSASHAMGPFQFKFETGPGPLATTMAEANGAGGGADQKGPFQFTFEPSPGPLASESTGSASNGGGGTPAGAAGGGGEQPRDGAGAAPQQQQPQPQMPALQLHAAKGRDGVLKRQGNPALNAPQEPIGCNMQLDECVARCRQEVQALAAECRRRGCKFSDPDFPADERALWRAGRAPASAQDQPTTWRRASEGALAAPSTPGGSARSQQSGQAPGCVAGEVLVHGQFGGVTVLGALAAVRSLGRDPRELIVWREPEAGICGVRLFKDGEWMYEVVDDLLPMGASGQPACSRAVAPSGETSEWLALVEKAYAKVHGCYEALADASEEEALEDISGSCACRLQLGEFLIWGELWKELRARRRRGYLQLAMRRVEAPGEVLTSGLVSGYGYPITRLEMVEGQMLCELQNPWPIGAWCGAWGAGSPEAYRLGPLAYNADSSRSFWMSIQDFVKNFTDVFGSRLVPSPWQSCSLPLSGEKASAAALVSVTTKTQAVFALSQSDSRLSDDKESASAIGLRLYRCRIVAPPQNAVGLRQNVSNPFRNLELVAERPMAKVHGCVIEVAHLEPGCLYIASMEASQPFPWANLRLLTAAPPRLRELFEAETTYFMQAQAAAAPVIDNESFSSQGSVDVCGPVAAPAPQAPHQRIDPMKRNIDGADGWEWMQEGGEAVKLPHFLQACMASCSGEC